MTDSIYAAKPWISLLSEAQRAPVGPAETLVHAFGSSVARSPGHPALACFDGRLSYRETDALSDSVAGHLPAEGLERGDRVAVTLQNTPQFVLALLGARKAGATAFPDGEPRTGDIGFMDSAGRLHAVDRKKGMINASGFKVWPREAEDVPCTHPAIREAAVVGVPDAYRGETVRACVSLRPGATVEPEELAAYCKERLAAYKYPHEVEILAELPKTASGKILRRELRSPR
ncbi:AMP-binding protein [Streptomyces sp. NPDC056831]|uniref:AMP-binding enzyme n=1 Tax=Streptomyces sp. NPDC056831 TaxID=3345954 RepID=UPI0036CDEE7B